MPVGALRDGSQRCEGYPSRGVPLGSGGAVERATVRGLLVGLARRCCARRGATGPPPPPRCCWRGLEGLVMGDLLAEFWGRDTMY